ncbi:hypothetical protein KFZ70_00515 [Tamlana fucoidanivorans]|uniref:Tail specific protease domain-containing protein n=1 Tax=Allotamlana fucoidanivorans TaxID=2583814 RepID=A0A5C4SCR7_9FLAO|nr:S41 family peptidase [Tamlana fucoidanivorans]TNJ41327.1 hypothetical protein FGF67_16180 [Tamlana fucoidanivorans]
MRIRIYKIGAIIFLFLFFSCKKENRKIDNILTFAKVYGYVKYFHPSDEASEIDWNKFSIYGTSQIEKCKTQEDIVNTLYQLFKPIAPSIEFATKKSAFDSASIKITPKNKEKAILTFWQHLGVSLDMEYKNQPYESRRIKGKNQKKANLLFDYEPEFGENIVKEIGDGIYCWIPMVLYSNNQITYPKANENKLNKVIETLKKTNDTNVEDLYLRLGNIVNVYNVFQHFYPYFDVVNVNWEKELEKAIEKCYFDSTISDHLTTLEQFTAPLKDGHIYISNNSIQNYYVPPISWVWIENKLVITKVFDNEYDIKSGDIVTKIDNNNPADFFKNIYGEISAATVGWLNYRANLKSLQGEENSKIVLTINNKNIELTRSFSPHHVTDNKKIDYQKIDNDTWYLNLDLIEMDTINWLLPQLEQCKSIICDLRGYPKGNHDFINHLMSVDDTTEAWMQVPKIIYPDRERIIGFQNYNWIGRIKAKKPYLGNKKIVFITNGQAISYAESYMGYIEGYELATIIGQPTAGTNGNVNPFTLPGGFIISWTGMKVLKHDGSQHHGIGILPDIYLEKTIKGIKEGRDEFLEKAIELTRNE